MLTKLTGGLNPSDPNYLSTLASNIQSQYVNKNKPLVLLPEWATSNESTVPDSGFTEAAADAIFASIVQLDQALGGGVGEDNTQGELVRLYDEQGDLIRTQGALFNSPLHFIGFSRGTVVNSEMIQRLGTYFPHAGGPVDANGEPLKDAHGQLVRDLQMTTIDPHDFYQESLKVDYVLPGTPLIADFRDFNEPPIKVWDNVTFADNYYQTLADPNGPTWTPNGRSIENADLNVLLNGRTGFTQDQPLKPWDSPHGRVFSWYAGTLDLGLDEALSGYEQQPKPSAIYDQLGEAAVAKLLNPFGDNLSITPWYSSEGVGTGWFYSKLGGGKRPNVDMSKRVDVGVDNTDEDIASGDHAVPTIFNGNFDVGISDQPNVPVPGWSFHNDEQIALEKYLVDKNTIPTLINENDVASEENSNPELELLNALLQPSQLTDKSFKLSNGTTKILTHDRFLVPDWGVLRFDLHVPNPNGGTLKISMKGTAPGDEWKELYTIRDQNQTNPDEKFLKSIDLTEYKFPNEKDIINRIDYGKSGFETFTLNIPDEFRGQAAEVQFELIGNNEVEIDNVFVQSDHLNLGNPTEARYNPNDPNNSSAPNSYYDNYLLEKPQYALSYNNVTKTSNWVSWKLDKKWLRKKGQPDPRVNPGTDDFRSDKALPISFAPSVGGSDYLNDRAKMPQYNLDENPILDPTNTQPIVDSYARGHIAPSADRTRSVKDNSATFLMTNIFPQQRENNSPMWASLERFERELVTKKDKELYIIAGGYGTFTDPRPFDPAYPLDPTKSPNPDLNKILKTKASNGQPFITVPAHLWKVIVVLDPNQNIEDIDENTPVIAVDFPNVNSLNKKWYENWSSSMSPIISVDELEARLNNDPLNKSQGILYNFFNSLEIKDSIKEQLKQKAFIFTSNPIDAFF